MKFRKKPVVVEAVQWTGRNIEEILAFIGDLSKLPNTGPYVNPGVGHCPPVGEIYIPTLEGEMTASAGDWIIKGVKGEFYPCKPDIFAATYEPESARADVDRDSILEEAAEIAENLGDGYATGSGYMGTWTAADAAKVIRSLKSQPDNSPRSD